MNLIYFNRARRNIIISFESLKKKNVKYSPFKYFRKYHNGHSFEQMFGILRRNKNYFFR